MHPISTGKVAGRNVFFSSVNFITFYRNVLTWFSILAWQKLISVSLSLTQGL